MRLLLKTNVSLPPDQVWAQFDEQLFKKLAPPFPRIRLLRFDGSTTGCTVEVELNFLLFRQIWQSEIIDHGTTEEEIWFVDRGSKLPFFLRFWIHRHRLMRTSYGSTPGTQIVDDIEYRTGSVILDYLMYPLMWAQFAYRGPIYRRAFNK
jgi:ligand-binding SRPBCC domain-containing protein